MKKLPALAAGALVGLAHPAGAHHSFAMFDRNRTVLVTGEVTKFEWTNPHSWLHVRGNAPNQPAKDWKIEMTSPNVLVYKGWRPNTFKAGDRVDVTIYPMRDGTDGGAFVTATAPGGRVLTQEAKIAPAR